MSCEKDMSRLSEIVKQLEGSEFSLEQSLDLYKEGVELSVKCKKSLDQAKLTVKNMNEDNSNE